MGVQVSFDPVAWGNQFPEFSNTVSQEQATALSVIVTSGLLRNDGGGPIPNAALQTQLFYYAVAHLAFIQYGTNTQPASELVGRISNASEGSVSVAVDYGTLGPSEKFWAQTKYGAIFWQMCAPFRTMRYRPGFSGVDAFGFLGGGIIGGWNYGNASN